jgi:predicted alpha/beta-hydrolase family hydrolase
MLAAAEPGLVDRLLLLSYPLHPPKQPDELRTGHFPTLQTPAMFVHGTRDGFGSMSELAAALRLIRARTELVPIAGAGHELLTKQNRDELPMMVVEAFQPFASSRPE